MSMSNIFPLRQVLDWREDSRRKAEVNRIEAMIREKEQEIARIGHEIWLLRLQRQGVIDGAMP